MLEWGRGRHPPRFSPDLSLVVMPAKAGICNNSALVGSSASLSAGAQTPPRNAPALFRRTSLQTVVCKICKVSLFHFSIIYIALDLIEGTLMNREVFFAMVKDVHEHPEHLANYRKKYKNVYPFSDGIFKMLMANEAKPERTVKFLNAMLELTGEDAIKTFTLGVQENPGVLDDKTAIFDIYGTTEAGNPVLIEVQQTFNKLFVDRLIYYTSRVVSRTVKKSQDYNLPHIYVLSILTENQFPEEENTYLHHSQIVRNRHFFYEKLDVYLVEIEKFFAIEDKTPDESREKSNRADILRIFSSKRITQLRD